MSAIGPQFYDFMKKLDENDGSLPSSITSNTYRPDFAFNNSTCYLCNGYYGPSFFQPVCLTCHEFLYPDIPQHVPNSYIFSEKTDDGDSGNDEPSVGELIYNDRRLTRALQQHGVPNWAFKFQNSLDSETSPEDLTSRPIYSIAVVDKYSGPSNSGNIASNSNDDGLISGQNSGAKVDRQSIFPEEYPISGPSSFNAALSGDPSKDPIAGPSGDPYFAGPIGGSISGGPNDGPKFGARQPKNEAGSPNDDPIFGERRPNDDPIFGERRPNDDPIFVERRPNDDPIFRERHPNDAQIFVERWDDLMVVPRHPNDAEIFGERHPNDDLIFVHRRAINGPILRERNPNDGRIIRERRLNDGPIFRERRPNDGPILRERRPNDGPILRERRPNDGPILRERHPNDGRIIRERRPNDGPIIRERRPNDDPILGEIDPNDGPIFEEIGPNDGPIFEEIGPNDGPIFGEIGPNDGPNFGERGPNGSRNHGAGVPNIGHDGAGPSHDNGLGLALPDDEQLQPLPSNLAKSLVALSTPRPPDNLAPGLVERLPSEVLLCLFDYLDDLSLCACALVCARWSGLVRAHVGQSRWAEFTSRRWPLFRPLINIRDWQKKYQALVESCFCRNCVVQMCMQTQPPFEENAWRRNRLRNEIKMLRNTPPEGCAATPLDPKCCHWQAMVTGPVGSPYEGGIFYLYIQVPYSYPMSPPVVRFLTRILHPNVSRHGDVGIDSVHHNWSLALTISKLLISIQSLLTDPYTAICMEPEVGDMYVNDRVRFERTARRWTWCYAMHDIYTVNLY